jgi:hypothetical protein
VKATDPTKLDRIVADARRAAAKREQGYREQALEIYPWICCRSGREFTHANLRELTVHHRDRNHDNNPPDGLSNLAARFTCLPAARSRPFGRPPRPAC